MWRPKRLLIGPGGAKGFLYLGVLLYMENHGLLEEVDTIVGVSIGSIIGLLISCGYKISEIIEHTITLDIMSIISRESIYGPYHFNLNESLNSCGLFDIDELIKPLLDKLILEKLGYIPTLSQIQGICGIKFMTVANNQTQKCAKCMSGESDPFLECSVASCLSANLPIVFKKKEYLGDVYSDGALRDPYPINLIDDCSTPVLGIFIENIYNENQELHQGTFSKFFRYLAQVIDSPIQEIRKLKIEKSSSACKHIPLYTTNIDTTGSTITIKLKEEMIASSYVKANDFFSNFL